MPPSLACSDALKGTSNIDLLLQKSNCVVETQHPMRVAMCKEQRTCTEVLCHNSLIVTEIREFLSYIYVNHVKSSDKKWSQKGGKGGSGVRDWIDAPAEACTDGSLADD